MSTHAYGEHAAVIGDVAGLDLQSHAHFHVIYRDADANRRNIDRAHHILRDSGTGLAIGGRKGGGTLRST